MIGLWSGVPGPQRRVAIIATHTPEIAAFDPAHGLLCRVALVWLLLAAPAAGAKPVLATDTPLATAGYYQLHWTADTPQVTIEVRSRDSQRAHTLYTGPDRATVISGQANGTRIYRAGEIGPGGNIIAWSEPVTVTVAHHPLSRALAFFAVGAVVFLATVVLIARGARGQQ